MSKTVLVGDDSVQMDLFSLNLKAYVGTETIILDSAEKLRMFLELDTSIDLIITHDKIDIEPTAQKIHTLLQKKKLSVPLCVIGPKDGTIKCERFLPKNVDIKELIKTVARIFDITAKDMIKQSVGDYYPVPISFFSRMNIPVCDVFLRLNASDGDYQYICKFKAGNDLDSKLLGEYQKKGIANLYVPSISRLKFTNNLSEQTIEILKSATVTPDSRISTADVAMNLMVDELESVGLTENTAELANNCINSIQKTIKEYPKLNNLLERLLNSPESWLYKYCQILTFVSHHIIDNSDWGSDEQKEKISFVVFFQDIAFMTKKLNPEKLAPIHSKEEFMNASLEKNESNVVLQHALMAADLVREFNRAPMEADVIIRQHHGSYNGVGFPDSISHNISHLAQVSVIAQSFTREIMKINDINTFISTDVIKKLKIKYPTHRLGKIVNNLSTLKF
ncbi:MAG: hypothetical protein KAQ98_09380 [Bacteriovoracaceae bacterium]|nr:hypothetical protein [Bacteriovoracaceae bacterium]